MKLKVAIEFELPDDWGYDCDDSRNLYRLLERAGDKVIRQMSRHPSLCTAPEADDVLRDVVGKIIGKVELKQELP